MRRHIEHTTYVCSFFALVLCLFLAAASVQAESLDLTVGASSSDLEELLKVIENPEKREDFVRNLKGIIAARKALDTKESGKQVSEGGAQQLLIVRWVFGCFEGISQDVKNAVIRTSSMIEQMPADLMSIEAFFKIPENRSRLFILLLSAGIAIIISLLSVALLVRPVRSSLEKMKTPVSKPAWGCVYILLKCIPCVNLWFTFALLFELMPSFPSGRDILLNLFLILFFYRMAMSFFHILLFPDEARLRILALSDENARYAWIWVRRFAAYALFYFVSMACFLWPLMGQPYFAMLRGILLMPFPVMLTVFVLQVAREIRMRRDNNLENQEEETEPPKKDKGRALAALIRYWPILATGYIWAIFLTLAFQYERGFEYLFHATVGTAATIFAMFLCLRVLDQSFRGFFRINERVMQRFPGMEARANRYVRIMRKGLSVVVIAMGCGVMAQTWGVPVTEFVVSDAGGMILLRGLAIVITLAVVVSVIEICTMVSAYLLKEKKWRRKKEISQKQKTLIPVIRTAINISAGFVGGIIILDRLGVNTTPILAGAGIIGLAIGFGSQTLVKDLINGLFILFEESIRVGDYATVGNQGGMVESVGLRTVRLRDLGGTVHVIPNSAIDSVSNYSKIYSRAVMDIGIAYREDVDEVMEILRELGEELQRDPDYGPSILEPLEIFGLDRFDDSAVIIRARFKTLPLKQWGVRREFYRRMKRRFDERGIEIPFPHQTIYMGEPKQGKAPPLYISFDKNEGPEAGGSPDH